MMKPGSGLEFGDRLRVAGLVAVACCLTGTLTGPLTARTADGATANSSGVIRTAPGAAGRDASGGLTRTRQEVDEAIARAGTTPPAWWSSVAVKHPPTLNLTWADPGKEWDAQKNLGQYIWDVINPNPGRWREGVRLLHHVLTLNKESPARLEKTAEALARMYQNLLQDWARAAFWWRTTARLGGYAEEDFALELGECYWKLGNRAMCVALLETLERDDTRNGSLIKLWADLGELDRALKLAEEKARSVAPDPAYLAAGDACRLAGRYDQALAYYRKVVALTEGWHDLPRNRERAAASIEAIQVFERLDLTRIPDGTYESSSVAYNGPLHVAVTVKGAHLEAVKVTRHQEKQFYSALTDTPARILEKQSVRGIDMTSGATITAEAIVNATAKALATGLK